ncbi:hypothetical protein DKP76_09945 [Falsochrobactrum shanghaiense]|uniref:Lipoprotein n=1 Tax=Falsochrobactrum shanghaiense TaxID=2201899 RepID=A0A316JAG1_9HYPH|nr:hypothetical protein [Falsochrobactrum shanghaiense]PWL18258.1 hypothetical protein DKP76_09945 [Falsochrobactrum shanghaiense]
MKMKYAFLAAPVLGLVAACTPTPAPGPIALDSSKGALSTMERIALGANSCWFKSKDKDFRGYTLAPELNSFSGRPRILVLPARNLAGRPVLVVQAEGNPARVEAFGPMMQQSQGARIAKDVNRWTAGQKGC